jgi:peptidoglycan/LPS O-acetylase OafA/YrhL
MWCFFRKEVTDMTKRWQDGVNMLLGLWLFISPWVMQYADAQAAAWNAYGMGTAIVVFAAVAVYMPKVWEELINTVCGLWLVISPYALGFASTTTVAVHTMVVGVLTVGFAVWAMLKDVEFDKWWHEHHFL